MDHYEVLVIGGGPGGYVAAIHAAQAGKRTAIIEQESLGGVCLNWGCIPTKSLLRNAEVLKTVQESDSYGLAVSISHTNYAKAQERSRQVAAQLVKGIGFLMKKNQITVLRDHGRLLENRQVLLTGSGKTVSADHIVLATGSSALTLPMLDYNHEKIMDAKKALQLKTVPKSIAIIGAGAIGMEMATIFKTYGADVYLIEMQQTVLPNEDLAISALMEAKFIKDGYHIHTGTRLIDVQDQNKNLHCVLEKNGTRFTVSCEYLLAATGIRPNSEGLSNVGIKLDKHGYVEVDAFMKTSMDGVYAVGDLTGKLALAHAASAQAAIAVQAICGLPVQEIVYEHVPKCTYTTPEVASAGLREELAISKGYDVGAAVFPLSANGKAIACGEDIGLVKIVFDKQYGQLLGVHMAGHNVTEMIGGMVGYLGLEVTLDELAEMIYPHPTISECLIEAAHLAQGKAIHI